jgi:hypothetical protein
MFFQQIVSVYKPRRVFHFLINKGADLVHPAGLNNHSISMKSMNLINLKLSKLSNTVNVPQTTLLSLLLILLRLLR